MYRYARYGLKEKREREEEGAPHLPPSSSPPTCCQPPCRLSRCFPATAALVKPHCLLFPATISSPHQPSAAQPLPLSPPASPLLLSSAAALVGLYCPAAANRRPRCCLPHASRRPSLPVARSSAAPHGAAFLSCLPATVAGQPLAVHSQRSLDPCCCLLCRSIAAHSNVVVAASQPRSPAAAALAGPRCPLLLFPAASTAAKPSSAAALISSSSSPPDSRCHLPSQPQPPPSAVPAPCFLCRCSRHNLLLNRCLLLPTLLPCCCCPRCRSRFQPHPYRCTSLLPPLHPVAAT
ncbi:hypothetical protein BHM03_00011464 [Ensete ventricosum]|nr:hypothetical protein BHM03_00011464 [Ensete ventricosum]